MSGVFDLSLAVLSCLVAVSTLYVAFNVVNHLTAQQDQSARFWLWGGALTLGAGIWAAHFIFLLSYRLPIPIGRDILITLVSVVIAAIVFRLALSCAIRESASLPQLLLAGAFIGGAGFAAMQYASFAAMKIFPSIQYIPAYGIASVLVYAAASCLGLWLFRYFRFANSGRNNAPWQKIGAALNIGAFYMAAQYLAMKSVVFMPNAHSGAQSSQAREIWMAVSILDPELFRNMTDVVTSAWDGSLAAGVAAGAFLLLGATLLVSMFDAKLMDRTTLLRESKENLDKALGELELILENASLGILTVVVEPDGRRIMRRTNRAFEQMLGYAAGELSGLETRIIFVSDEEYEQARKAYREDLRSGRLCRAEHVFKRKDGESIIVNVVGTLIDLGDPSKGTIWLMEDVTERRRLEAELAEKSALLQTAIEHMPGAMVVLDSNLRYTHWTRETEPYFKIPPEMLKVGADFEAMTRYFAQRGDFGLGDIDTLVQKELRPLQARENILYERNIPGGVTLEVRRNPLPSGGYVSIIQDITERKRMEKALLDSRRRMADIINLMPEPVLVTDQEGRVQFWNRALEELTGYQAEQMLGKGNLEYSIPFYGERRPILIDLLKLPPSELDNKYTEVFRPNEILTGEAFVPALYGGKGAYLAGTAGMLYDSSGNCVGAIEIMRDITERRRAEQATLEAKAAAELAREKVISLLDNSGQGFLSFGSDLVVDPECSRACIEMLGQAPAGRNAAEVLFADDADKANLLRLAVPEALSEKDTFKCDLMLSLLPAEFQCGAVFLEAEYKVLENRHVMVVLTDVTEERRLKERVESERQRLEMIVAAVTDSRDFFDTVDAYRAFVCFDLPKMIIQLSEAPAAVVQEIYRQVHTYKGLLNQFSFQQTPLLLHEIERQLDGLLQSKGTLTRQMITDVVLSAPYEELLDTDLMVLREALGDDFLESRDGIVLTGEQAKQLEDLASHLLRGEPIDTTVAEIRKLLLDIGYLRKVPIRDVLKSYDRLIKQVAERQEKEVAPMAVIGGKDVWIAPEVYRPFLHSLGHVFRNAVVHGIEPPDERLATGKPEVGAITCIIQKDAEAIKLSIADDGAGIDTASLRRKAAEIGLFPAGQIDSVPEEQILELVFMDNISTNSEATLFAGRGVGLAAVRKETRALGGDVVVRTTPGKGTKFQFVLPAQDHQPRGGAILDASGLAATASSFS